MPSRRELLAWGLAGLTLPEAAASGETAPSPNEPDLGSLYPFIAAQATEPARLSWIRPEFRDLRRWKRIGRRALSDRLCYAPPRCVPDPQLLERERRSGYTLERLTFRTAPGVSVPACLLLPDRPGRCPGVVALHDHGAFYLFGKEKLLEQDAEPAALTAFRNQYYAGRPIAADLARQGYVVLVIDMFYWGERRLLHASDPDDWVRRPPNMPSDRVAAFNRRASELEDLTGRTIHSAGFTWPGVM